MSSVMKQSRGKFVSNNKSTNFQPQIKNKDQKDATTKPKLANKVQVQNKSKQQPKK